LKHSLASDKRRGQSVIGINKIIAIAAFCAEVPFVDPMEMSAAGANDRLVMDVEVEGATHAAKRADGMTGLHKPNARAVFGGPRCEGPYGTDVHTLAAKLATKGLVEGRGDNGSGTPVLEVECAHALLFPTNPHALSAKDAPVGVGVDERVFVLRGAVARGLESPPRGAILVCKVLEGALSGLVANRTFEWVVGEHQFNHGLSDFIHLLGMGEYFHSVINGGRARGKETGLPLELDETHPASAMTLQPGVIAQMRYIDAVVESGFKYRRPFWSREGLTVYGQLYHTDTSFPGRGKADPIRIAPNLQVS
jgi:hypothetical protein